MYTDIQVHWHRSLDEVPDDLPTVYIAHEFLDALPVHQFQKTERGWCERLVDVASDDSPLHFRLVLAPRPTPASKLLVERRLGALPFDQSKPSMHSRRLSIGLLWPEVCYQLALYTHIVVCKHHWLGEPIRHVGSSEGPDSPNIVLFLLLEDL